MWASQLRDYRQQTDRKSSRIPSRRGCGVNHAHEPSTGSNPPEDEPVNLPDVGYSLYSSGEELAAKTTKNLDSCAKLLTVMMDREPSARGGNEQKTPKVVASKVKKAKGAKQSMITSKRPAEKVALRKNAPKVLGHSVRRKENIIDSVSETSTDLQVRLVGPTPLPLNNSETVIQIVGTEPEILPKTQPGKVVMTTVPYDERILSSTPLGSPSSKSRQVLVDNKRVCPVSVQAQTAGVSLQETPLHNSSYHGDLSSLDDKQLGHLLRSFLAQGQTSHVASKDQVGMQGLSAGHPECQGHSENLGRNQEAEKGPNTHISMGAISEPMYGSRWQGNKTYVSQQPGTMESQRCRLPLTTTSDVDIDVILQRHGIQIPAPQPSTLGGYASNSPLEGAPLTIPGIGRQVLETQPLNGVGTEYYGLERGQRDVELSDPCQEPPTRETIHQPGGSAGGPAPELVADVEPVEDDTLVDIPGVTDLHIPDKVEGRQKKTSKTPETIKKKKGKRSSGLKGTALSNMKSPSDVKSQVRALQVLFGELRSIVVASGDREVKRLLCDMEKVLVSLTPGLSSLTLSTEIDLAMQPLRSENAQLRRRIRILTQQFKDKVKDAEDASKADPTYQTIHLELQRQSLETQVKEETEAREKLQAAVATLSGQVQGLMTERQNMIQLLASKDSDHLKSQQDWIGEASSLRAKLQVSQQEVRDLEKSLESINHEATLLEVSVKQKDKEIARLQNLVGSLQGSMSRLLDDLKGHKPKPLNDITAYLQNIDTLLRTDRPLQLVVDPRPVKGDAYTPSVPARPSIHQHDFYHLREVTPSDVREGQQRAQQLLTRMDAAMSPPGGMSHNQSTPDKFRESRRKADAMTSPVRTDARWQDDYETDYMGRLTQELLEEHDRQNGFDRGAINRMLQKEQLDSSAASESRPNTVDNLTPSIKYASEVGKEMLNEKLQPHDVVGNLTGESQTPVMESSIQQSFPPNIKKPNRSVSGSTDQNTLQPVDLDSTQYMSPPPPGKIKGQGQLATRSDKGQGSSGPTVRELLAPFADRIMCSPGKHLRGTLFSEISPPSSNVTSDTLTSYSSDPGGEGDPEADSTLVEDPKIKGVEHDKSFPPSMSDTSRYSMNDYFKKYPQGDTAPSSNIPTQQATEGRAQDSAGKVPLIMKSVTQPVLQPESALPEEKVLGSSQGQLYHGTELDTSLSTIEEAETNSVFEGSTVTSVSSLASVDEVIFRDGLAKLDENIARIQQSLKKQKSTSWK